MAKWKEFASIFGLDFDEKFKIKERDLNDAEVMYEEFFRFSEDGLQWLDEEGNWHPACADDIEDLVTGKAEVIRMPWKPKDGHDFWAYNDVAEDAFKCYWYGDYDNLCFWKSGNCFKTEEEALTKGKELMEALRKEFENE